MEVATGTPHEVEFTSAATADDWSGSNDSAALGSVPLAGLAFCQWPDLDPAESASHGPGGVDAAKGQVRLQVVLGHAQFAGDPGRSAVAGQVVVLREAAAAPVEILQDNRLLARGQLRSLDGRYCVQITELITDPSAFDRRENNARNRGTSS